MSVLAIQALTTGNENVGRYWWNYRNQWLIVEIIQWKGEYTTMGTGKNSIGDRKSKRQQLKLRPPSKTRLIQYSTKGCFHPVPVLPPFYLSPFSRAPEPSRLYQTSYRLSHWASPPAFPRSGTTLILKACPAGLLPGFVAQEWSSWLQLTINCWILPFIFWYVPQHGFQ